MYVFVYVYLYMYIFVCPNVYIYIFLVKQPDIFHLNADEARERSPFEVEQQKKKQQNQTHNESRTALMGFQCSSQRQLRSARQVCVRAQTGIAAVSSTEVATN